MVFGHLNLVLSFQDVDSSRTYINDLYSDDDNNKVQESLVFIKNVVIGSDKQKTIVISQGIVPRLMFLLSQDTTPLPIRYDAAIVLGNKKMMIVALNGETEIFDLLFHQIQQVHYRKVRMIMYCH